MKAVLFDLHGTLAYVENPVSEWQISEYLFSRGYEVSPQQLRAAWFYVSMIDYPKHGYENWLSYFSRILWRLQVKVDKQTLDTVVKLLKSSPYRLYPDAAETVIKAKKIGLRTAIVTTIAYFQFKDAVQSIKNNLDFIMTGYEAGCDKSNPKMYKKVLDALNVKPQEAVMVGDNIPIDIILPKKLGIKAILLDREGKNKKCLHADAVVNGLNNALETIIRKFS